MPSSSFTAPSSRYLPCTYRHPTTFPPSQPVLIVALGSESINEQKLAAMEFRLCAKNKPENRLKIAKAGAIKPFVGTILSSDLNLQENGVTTLINLSLYDENKEAIESSGTIKPLVRALKTGP